MGNSTKQPAGLLDTALLRNGAYLLRLTAFDVNGLGTRDEVHLVIDGWNKPGSLRTAAADLEIELEGIPIQVNRTYDSTDLCPGDFGYGWNLSEPEVAANIALGGDWQIDEQSFCVTAFGGVIYPPYAACSGAQFPLYCLDGGKPHYVAVTLPGGKTDVFDVSLDTWGSAHACMEYAVPDGARPVFTPREHVTAQLQVLGGETWYVRQDPGGNHHLVDLNLETWDPKRFRYTTAEGIIFDIHAETGLEAITDLEGNRVTYSRNAITHDQGIQVAIQRDNQDRITRVTDPNGGQIHYFYDERGDLVRVVDRVGRETRYSYDDHHLLIGIEGDEGAVKYHYDAEGFLIATEDIHGNRIEIEHDRENRQERIRGLNGALTVHEYDERGNVLRTTDPHGTVTTYAYDDRDNEVEVVRAAGTPLESRTTRVYDGQDRIIQERDPSGRVLALAYNEQGDPLSVMDSDRLVFQTTYDEQGNLTEMVDALGRQTRWTRLEDGARSESRIDALGGRDIEWLDPFGRPHRERDARGLETLFRLDAGINPIRETTRDGTQSRTITRTFDGEDRVLSETDALGATTRYSYDAAGNQDSVTDPLGRRTEEIYDRGLLVRTNYPDGTSEINSYDALGNLLTETDRGGRITRHEYDLVNRNVRTLHADGTESRREYDQLDRLVLEIGRGGAETRYEYDQAGRRIAEIDNDGNRTEYVYNQYGALIRFTDARGHSTHYEYDEKLRPITTILPDGARLTATLDALDRKSSETNALGHQTRFAYDAVGNLVRVVDALGGVTEYSYNAFGEKIAQTDANGQVTRWQVDGGGRVVSRILPLGQTEHWRYDAAGNIIARTDFNGQTIEYAYDALDRLIEKRFENGERVRFNYTAAGQRETVADQRGITRYSYDLNDRLIALTYPDGEWIRYAYDGAGNRTLLETAHQRVTYAYDALNRMVRVTDSQGGTTHLDYDAVGNLLRQRHGNGMTATYRYDAINRLLGLAYHDDAGQILFSQDFSLDAAGNRVAVQESGDRRVTYQLDALQRLVEERVEDPLGTRLTQYTYDPVGNRLREVEDGRHTDYSYNANDQLLERTTAGETTAYSYDANGNQTQSWSAAGLLFYDYDAENRLIGVRGEDWSMDLEMDVDGIRHAKTVDGMRRDFLVDPNRAFPEVIERDEGGNRETYVYAAERLTRHDGTHTTHYLADAQNSIRATSKESGTLLNRGHYTAYGIPSHPAEFGYTGEAYDSESGLLYLRARYYDSTTGRFLGMDPFFAIDESPKTLHRYAYVNNSPTEFIDPAGYLNLIETTFGLDIQQILKGGQSANYRLVFEKVGCILIEAVLEDEVEKVLSGVYIAFDQKVGKPYVGLTNDFDRRFPEHKRTKNLVEGLVVKFHIDEKDAKKLKNHSRLIEQLLIDEFGGPNKKIGNKNNSIAEKPSSANSKLLRQKIKKVRLCR